MPSQICSVPPASWTVGLLRNEPLLVAPGLIDHHGLSQLPWGSRAAPAPRFNPPDPQSCWRLTPLPTQPSAMPQGLATHRGGPPSLTPRKGKSRRWQVNSPSHHQTLLSHSGPTWAPHTSLLSKLPVCFVMELWPTDICFSSLVCLPLSPHSPHRETASLPTHQPG